MKNIFNILYVLASLLFLLYLILPGIGFPKSPDASLQSKEPADVESFFRRGYYINESRTDVINYYRNVFDNITVFNRGFSLLSIRLNYPPEEAQTIIRDQTRSTYLEEIVHPFRESLYINGFEPKKDNDRIVVNGRIYQQKITIKLVEPSVFARVVIGLLTVVFGYIVILFWINLLSKNKNIYAQ